MAISAVTANTTGLAADLNQYRNHLLGLSSSTAAYVMRSSTGDDFIVVLSDAAGARRFSVRDSADVEVASIDSDGNLVVAGTTFTTLNLPTAASPSQTADGRIVWDSDDNRITVGDGTGRQTFFPGNPWILVGVSTTEATMTSATAAALVTISSLTIPATAPVMIVTSFRKSANAFQPSIGLAINATTIVEPVLAGASIGTFAATAEVQNGVSVVILGPRRTNYDRAVSGYYASSGATGGQEELIPAGMTALTAAIPIATITDVIIRGDSDGTNTLGVQGVYVYQGAETV